MEDTQQVILDARMSHIIRSYKQNDNLFYAYGVDNIVFGMIKTDSFSYESFQSIMPIGVSINGVIAVYNENTYEDFEGVLAEEIEKIKKEIGEESNKRKFISLAVKEMLNLDDYETMEFEFKKYGDNTEIEVKYVDNAIDNLYKDYYVLKSQCHILTGPENKGKGIECPKDFQALLKEGKFVNLIDDKQNLMIDNVGNLTDENVQHITKFIEKIEISSINKNTNDLKCINIELGIKPGDIIKEISLPDVNIVNSDKYDIKVETIGIVSKKSNDFNKVLSAMYSRFSTNITTVTDSLTNTSSTSLVHSVVVYNSLFTPIPFAVTSTVEFTREENKITLLDKSSIKESELIHNSYHIKGLSLFNTHPLVLTPYKPSHLLNIHINVDKPIGNEYIVRSCVKGNYEYFHYNHDGINDSGWGCAYRSLQTVFSWFLLNTDLAKGKTIPSIKEIQTTLVKLGDKDKSLIGSADWIGAVEVNLVLNELLGIESQIVFIPSGSELASKGRELAYHFEHNGCPVMIGGGKFAYTILGVDYDRVKGECMFLILDPHYGGEDDPKTQCNKGWCSWKTISLFTKENFYNMCMPIIP